MNRRSFFGTVAAVVGGLFIKPSVEEPVKFGNWVAVNPYGLAWGDDLRQGIRVLPGGEFEFNNIWARGDLHAGLFVKEEMQTLGGHLVIAADTIHADDFDFYDAWL